MIEPVKGMPDVLPHDQGYWDFLEDTLKRIAYQFDFTRIRTPLLEKTELFIRSVGKQTDLVQKELYSFKTKGGDALTLKPENTVPVMRAYLENGMKMWTQPVKLYYLDAFFRHERLSHLTWRQFHQIGFEEIGLDGSGVDAELIYIAHRFLTAIGLDNYEFQVNTLGDEACQGAYLSVLRDYLKTNKQPLCVNCQGRIAKRPLSVLDCKEEKCQRVARIAPKTIDALCEPCREHFKEVLELLDELEVPYALNPFVVRGLEYYARTIFEIWLLRDNELDPGAALGGGGRYDGLARQIGGEATPGSGFGLGVERIIETMRERGIQPPYAKQGGVFIAQLGFQAKKRAMRLFAELLSEGMPVHSSFARDSLSAQLRMADKLGTDYAVVLGEKELYDRSVILRDMRTGNQETLELKDLLSELKNRLALS